MRVEKSTVEQVCVVVTHRELEPSAYASSVSIVMIEMYLIGSN